MLEDVKSTDLFCEYYAKWIEVYKEGAIRKVTMDKYRMTLSWLVKLAPKLTPCKSRCQSSISALFPCRQVK